MAMNPLVAESAEVARGRRSPRPRARHPPTSPYSAARMSAQAKLAAALKKKADDDDVPAPPLAPIAPSADRDTLKLRKSNLLGTTTWEAVAEKLALSNKHEYKEMMATVQKMFGNVLANPTEPKYRKIKVSNPNFQAVSA